MKLKKFEKGLTLVEVIVATALFAITCAVLFTAILFALKNNKENVYAGREIQMQMNTAENYNSNQTYLDNKVSAHRFSGTNKVRLSVNFSRDTNGNATGNTFTFTNKKVYAFQANAGYEDRTASYFMRFFDPEDVSLYDVDSKKFWVRFHNYSGVDEQREVYANQASGVSLYVNDPNDAMDTYNKDDLADSTGAVSLQFGVSLKLFPEGSGDSIMFVGEWDSHFYEVEDYSPDSTYEFEFTEDNFYDFAERDDSGNLTGYVDVYCDSNGFHNKQYMMANHPELGIA